MTAALLARRSLSIGDISVIEVSDSLELRPNPTPIGSTVLDLKYVSSSGNEVVDSQQMNHEHDIDQEIDKRPYRVEEAEVIKISTIEKIIGLKNDLISWIEKWNLLRERKLKYKEQVKKILLKN